MQRARETLGQGARAVRARKARDAGLLLPLAGLVLLMPPVARLFAVDAWIGGVPLVVAYVFAVWAGLIAAAYLLGRRLGATPAQSEDD
ncbi:MAG: hypothetical protein AAGI34_09540 [Pseudomonadota bacterium]